MKRALTKAQKRGRVTKRDAAAALSLHAHGLHPAQAAVGTGLLTAQEATEYGIEIPTFGSVSPGQQTGRLLHIILRDANRANAHHVRILPTGSEADIIFDNGGERRVPASVLPALALRSQRIAGRRGWHVEILQAGTGPAMHFIRKRSPSSYAHPSDWSSVLQEFRSKPDGLLVVIAPDAYVSRHLLTRFSFAQSIDDWRKAGDAVLIYDADITEGREMAIHGALSGKVSVALMARHAEDWWRPVAEAGFTVRVLRARLTEAGPAWEIFRV